MDMTASTEARSDQINADDLIGGPILVTISEVVGGKADQPFDFKLVEHPKKAYRPNKTMRRVIIALWGPETSNYHGRQLVLYREPTVKWAGEPVGGIQISHASHIDAPREVWAQVTRGNRQKYVVQPLTDSTPAAQPQDAPMTTGTRGRMFALFGELGISDEAAQRAGMRNVLGREVESRGSLTEAEARRVIVDLEGYKRQQQTGGNQTSTDGPETPSPASGPGADEGDPESPPPAPGDGPSSSGSPGPDADAEAAAEHEVGS